MRGVAAFVEQRVDGAEAAADLIRFRLRGEVDRGRHPAPGLGDPARHRSVAEPVLMLARTLEQVQLHRRTPKLDPEPAEAVDPATQRESEGQVRVEPADDVAGCMEPQIPWRGGGCTVTRAKVREGACVGRVSLPDEVVEQMQQRRRLQALVLLQFQVEVVCVAERAGKTVAEADQLQESVIEDPPFDVAEGVE